MFPRRRRHSAESWQQTQQRLIAETSVYLTECLQHPELAVRIPVVQAGKATFPRSLTPAFWNRVLDEP